MGDRLAGGSAGSVVPLLVGILGPRAISEGEAGCVKLAVGDVLPGIEQSYPHSEVLAVTSMAAGTDTVAAHTAHELGFPVVALLPLDVDDYAMDFGAEEAPLTERLELAQSVWVNPGTSMASRDARYQACGRLLARLSTTMLVAWNGVPPGKPGGTADTLYFALPEVAALPDLSGGPSALTTERSEVVVFAPDGSEPIARMGPGITRRPWMPGDDPVSQRIDEFNRNAGPTLETDGAVMAIQGAADRLASRLQTRYRRWTTFLLVLGVLAVVSVDIQAELTRAWFLGVQALALITVLGTWWGMNRWGGKRRFEEYRALAEGARVQEAWQKAGVDECVADHYLQPLGPEGYWMRRALRTSWFLDLVNPPPAIQDPNPASARGWIQGQLRYFEGTSDKPGAIRRNARKAAQMTGLAWGFVAVALVGLVPGIVNVSSGLAVASAAIAMGNLAWGLGGASAAATVAYSQLMGYARAAKRGSLSLEMYRQALIDFDSVGSSLQAQRRIVLEVGREALRETGDWLAMNTSQSVRPV
jgi:hypothetical protein